MIRWRWALATALVLAIAACGKSATSTTERPPSSSAGPQRYQIDATVLESPEHGPQLCAGGVLESLPPQCGGPDILGWDWATAEGEESVGGTIWGEYHLVGTYDGTTFTLTEPPAAPLLRSPAALPDFTTPCPEPPGGWDVVDPSLVTLDDYQAFSAAAQNSADYAGMWVDQSTNHDGIAGVPMKQVMNVAYTGDLDRHRAELAAVWGGPICVVSRPRAMSDLRAVATDLIGEGQRALGLEVLSSGVSDVDNVVTASVLVLDPDTQRRVDERYGTGVVVLDAVMQPVS
jgi:hypothetical protein